jgi:hypothetical protein
MKRAQLFFLFLGFATLLKAQQNDQKLMRDGVILREGKTYKIEKDGSTSPLLAEIEFSNGAKISKYGDITFANGLKTKLREGEVMLKNGSFGILQNRLRMLSGYIKREGKMLEILPGELRPIDVEKNILDSNRLTADGKYYFGKSGKYIQIAENEVLTLKGEIFLNTDGALSPESFVLKRDGLVIKAVNNKMAIIEGEYLFPNGTKVNDKGFVTMKEGVNFSLKNGEKLNSKGELFLNNEMLFSNGIIKKDGLLYLLKDGKLTVLNEDYVLDTTRITVNGIVVTGTKQQKFIMREGDVVGLDGKLMLATTPCAEGSKNKKSRFVLDHVTFKQGKVFIIKDAETSLLTNDITLTNGSKILKIGQVVKPNGSRILMHEGQRIALTGDELPDEKPEESVNSDKNYLTMLHGRMWLVTDGKPATLKEDYNINNKMVVKTDGIVLKTDGSKFLLKEKDRISFEGQLIPLEKRTIPGQLPNEYYIMKMGKMWSVIDGKPTKLEKDIITKEGTKVLLDGTIVKKDKQRFVLKENEKVDAKGEIISSR